MSQLRDKLGTIRLRNGLRGLIFSRRRKSGQPKKCSRQDDPKEEADHMLSFQFENISSARRSLSLSDDATLFPRQPLLHLGGDLRGQLVRLVCRARDRKRG